MALVKLEIDGKRVIADSGRSILEVARENGIHSIPTLCHDDQLEPFASCFVCVVKVKGARSLLPACSTKVTGGMVVETNSTEVRNARKVALELLLSNHYADCIGPCQAACPAGIDIQGYVALAALGKYDDAIKLIKERNPLPAVCGRVCTRPCEIKGCRRTMLDEPVGIDFIKRYIADLDLAHHMPFRPNVAPKNGKRVAVVGAGPAGLSCAYYLAQKGYDVQILETLPEAGGMLRYGIPEYRLPKDVLDLEIAQILDLGVNMSTNVSLGKDFTVASLREAGFDAVFLGLGAWESTKMRVQDEDSEGVLSGIEFLKNVGLRKKTNLSGKVLVVGGGNTAIDCARTALRSGASEVHIVYRRTRKEMPANEVEIHDAEHEGVYMDFLVAPTRVVTENGRVKGLECLRMELGEPDSSGRRSPKPVRGSEFVMEAGWVLAAIGQGAKIAELLGGKVPNFLPYGEALNLTRWQTVQVNERTFETSVDGVFSGGDVQTGAATVVEALSAGRKAAFAIDKYISTGKAQPEPAEFFSRKDSFGKVGIDQLRSTESLVRRQMPALGVQERVKSFVEVETGFSAEDTSLETHRCLECGCSALFTCDLRRFASEYSVDVTPYLAEVKKYDLDRTHPTIILDPNKCVLCARCVRTCSELLGVSAYGLINRGFSTVVKPAMGGSLLDTDCVSCGMCVATCPTGAIAEASPLAKPGPWNTEPTPTVCGYCGVGCELNYESYGQSLITVSRRETSGPTRGHHCKKGRFGYNYVQSPERLKQAKVRAGREFEDAAIDDGLQAVALRLRELRHKYSGNEVAVFVSPRLTNEEIYLAQKLARVALGTHNVTSFTRLVNQQLHCPEVMSTATYRDLEDAQVIVAVNSNTAGEHFVVDALAKRAIRSGGKLIYVGAGTNRTSQFADTLLTAADGKQVQAMLALCDQVVKAKGGTLDDAGLQAAITKYAQEQTGADAAALAQAAELIAKASRIVVLFNKDYRGLRVPGDERYFASVAKAIGASVLALQEKSNSQGLLDMGANPAWLPGYVPTDDAAAIEHLEKEWCVALKGVEGGSNNVAGLLKQKKIKAAIVIGEDPVGCPEFPKDLVDGLLAAEYLVVADVFMTATAGAANVVLPLSTLAETSGTLTNQERRVQKLESAIAPESGMQTWQILCDLGAQMGYRFKMRYSNVGEVMAEIRKVAPIYGADQVWNLSNRPTFLPENATKLSALAQPIKPLATIKLDCLEARFESWFDANMVAAKKSAEASHKE